jgi:AcrR family transcriptional regulator
MVAGCAEYVDGVQFVEVRPSRSQNDGRFSGFYRGVLINTKLKREHSGTAGESRRRKNKRGPGPGRPTPAQARQRNLELLDRALDLFLEKGYEGTTIEGIAAAVGMAKRTVYAQYGDKKTLFMASLQRAIDDWIVPVDVLLAAETEDFEETLTRVGYILVNNMMTPKGMRLLRITNAEANRMPEISTYTYSRGTGPTLAYLADLFTRRGSTEIDALDAKEAALAFLNLVVGGPANMTAWGVAVDEVELQRHTRYCIRLFLRGFLSPTTTSAPG